MQFLVIEYLNSILLMIYLHNDLLDSIKLDNASGSQLVGQSQPAS